MVLFVFRIIFLVVMVVGAIIMVVAPYIYPAGKASNESVRARKVTKLRLIGLIVGAVGLLVVLILAYFN